MSQAVSSDSGSPASVEAGVEVSNAPVVPAPPGLHLVAIASEAFWPLVQSFVHAQRQPEGLRRVCLFHGGSERQGRLAAERFAHWIRQEYPAVKVETAEGSESPALFRARLESWIAEDPDAPWLLDLTSARGWAAWGAEPFLGRAKLRVLQRQTPGGWMEWTRNASGDLVATPYAGMGRDQTDELPVLKLARAFAPLANREGGFTATPVTPLPLAALTERALERDWDWKAAFTATGIEAGAASATALFERFVGGLVQSLGIKNAVHLRRSRAKSETTSEPEALVWINASGRLGVLDVQLVGDDGDGASSAPEAVLDPATRVRREIERAAADRRAWAGLDVEWLLVRPCLAFNADQLALAKLEGLRVVDEAEGSHLPTRIAEWLGVPLSSEGVEIERLLRAHLAASGRVRVFGREPASVRRQLAAGSDPIVVHVDALVESIREERRQNWLIWKVRDRVFVRLPTEGRASAAADWTFLVAGIAGLEPTQVSTQETSGPGRYVVLEFPDTGKARDQVRDWLRPFLNASVAFAAAQARFFSLARISQEAAVAPTSTPMVAAPAVGAPAPARRATKPSAPGPGERRAAPPSAPRERPPKNSLADLDRALDDAFGG